MMPHSRACGMHCKGHGVECSTNCPSCHGLPWSPWPAPHIDAPHLRKCRGAWVVESHQDHGSHWNSFQFAATVGWHQRASETGNFTYGTSW